MHESNRPKSIKPSNCKFVQSQALILTASREVATVNKNSRAMPAVSHLGNCCLPVRTGRCSSSDQAMWTIKLKFVLFSLAFLMIQMAFLTFDKIRLTVRDVKHTTCAALTIHGAVIVMLAVSHIARFPADRSGVLK